MRLGVGGFLGVLSEKRGKGTFKKKKATFRMMCLERARLDNALTVSDPTHFMRKKAKIGQVREDNSAGQEGAVGESGCVWMPVSPMNRHSCEP